MEGYPTIIIGLGGTGLQVLQRIKERLIETYCGAVPPTISLIEIDTTAQAVNFCGVTLAEQDADGQPCQFYWLQPDANGREWSMDDVLEQANDDPRWSWLEVARLDQTLNPNQRAISTGAGQYRPVGRSGLFLQYNRVRQTITQAMKKIRQQDIRLTEAEQQRISNYLKDRTFYQRAKVNIFIVGSLAGGTGAGMLLDIAALIRDLKDHTPDQFSNVQVIGVIPTASLFVDSPEQEKGRRLSNTFAGLRELDRLLVAHRGRTPFQFTGGDGRELTIANRLFDAVCLIDANVATARDRMNADTALAAMADWIVAHTDRYLGLILNERWVNVPTEHYQRRGTTDEAYQYLLPTPYSAFNVHTVIFPREDVATALSMRFLRELLDDHLIPDSDAGMDQPIPFQEFWNNVRQRAENRGDLGKSRDTGDAPIDGLPELVQLVIKGALPDWSNRDELRNRLLTGPDERNRVKREIKECRDRARSGIDDPEAQARAAIKWCDDWLGEPIDSTRPDGARKGGRLAALQAEILPPERRRINDYLEQIVTYALNGRDQEGRLLPNRLKYARSVMEQLRELAIAFKRNIPGSDERDERRRMLFETIAEERGKTPFLLFDPTKRIRKRLSDLADAELEYWMLSLAREMIDALVTAIDQASDELKSWQQHLRQVRERIATDEQQFTLRRREKYNIAARSYITDAGRFGDNIARQIEEDLYKRHRDAIWTIVLTGIGWQPSKSNDRAPFEQAITTQSVALRLRPNDSANKYPTLSREQSIQSRLLPDEMAREWQVGSARLWQAKLRFDGQARIAHYLPDLYNKDWSELRRQVIDQRDSPLLRLNPRAPGDAGRSLLALACNPESEQDRVREFVERVQQGMGQGFIDAVESQVALTFLYNRYGLAFDEIVGITECEEQYRVIETQQGCSHIFVEERNAVAYERKIGQLNRPAWRKYPRRLHPAVAAGLGDLRRVRSFALACLTGLVIDDQRDAHHLFLQTADGMLRLTDQFEIVDFGIMHPNDRRAALLLQAFHTWTLLRAAIDEYGQEQQIDLAAVQGAIDERLGERASDRQQRAQLVAEWCSTDNHHASPIPLFHSESRDPRFLCLGMVLTLELEKWRDGIAP